MSNIISPITGSYNTSIVETFKTDVLIEQYKKFFNIDVAPYFKGLDEVSKCHCKDSDFYFIHPRTTAGDGVFYDQLQKLSWYYQDWKWEFSAIEDLIGIQDRVLEVGCGKGAFLKKLQSKGTSVMGLELSNDAVEWGRKNEIKVINESIEEFSKKNKERFSVVCSFQVLEHVSDVKAFIGSSIDALEKGGKLICAIPDNDNLFFKYQNLYSKIRSESYFITLLLNLPPHHMNFWTKSSLEKLQLYYPVKLDKFMYEPDHYGRTHLTREILVEKICSNFLLNNRIAKALLRRTLKMFHFKGDTIIAIYYKV